MRNDLPSEELEQLLVRRTTHLLAQLRLGSVTTGPGPILIPQEVAMVFHAATRLYGEAELLRELDGLKLNLHRHLNELCLDCGQPAQDQFMHYCTACSQRHIIERDDLLEESERPAN